MTAFYVRNRFGKSYLIRVIQVQPKLTAVLIKQFTHALTWAPIPLKRWNRLISSSTIAGGSRRGKTGGTYQ